MDGLTFEQTMRRYEILSQLSQFSRLKLKCLVLEQQWARIERLEKGAIPGKGMQDFIRRRKVDIAHEVRMLRIDIDVLRRRIKASRRK